MSNQVRFAEGTNFDSPAKPFNGNSGHTSTKADLARNRAEPGIIHRDISAGNMLLYKGEDDEWLGFSTTGNCLRRSTSVLQKAASQTAR